MVKLLTEHNKFDKNNLEFNYNEQTAYFCDTSIAEVNIVVTMNNILCSLNRKYQKKKAKWCCEVDEDFSWFAQVVSKMSEKFVESKLYEKTNSKTNAGDRKNETVLFYL